jgi:phosphohistidine phosphatase
MRIYLVQHGEARSEEEDPNRRLTEKGIREVKNVVDFLRPLELRVDAIWHSGKARAQETGELLARAVWARDGLLPREGLGPKDQVTSTKEALELAGGDLMIVGHIPFLSKLVALLVTGNETSEIVEFRFASVVCVERPKDRGWRVAWMVTPSLLDSQKQ